MGIARLRGLKVLIDQGRGRVPKLREYIVLHVGLVPIPLLMD